MMATKQSNEHYRAWLIHPEGNEEYLGVLTQRQVALYRYYGKLLATLPIPGR